MKKGEIIPYSKIEMLNNLQNSKNDFLDLSNITGYYFPEISAAAGMDKEMQNDDLKRIPVTIPGWDKEISFIGRVRAWRSCRTEKLN